MKTAKALGILKGNLVITQLGFPGVVVADAHTCTPMLEVFGPYHECGSAYAHELTKCSMEEFRSLCIVYKHDLKTVKFVFAITRKLLT